MNILADHAAVGGIHKSLPFKCFMVLIILFQSPAISNSQQQGHHFHTSWNKMCYVHEFPTDDVSKTVSGNTAFVEKLCLSFVEKGSALSETLTAHDQYHA